MCGLHYTRYIYIPIRVNASLQINVFLQINITDTFWVGVYYKRGNLEFKYQTHPHLISLLTSDVFPREIG